MKKLYTFLLLTLFIIIFTISVSAQFVRVISDFANIRVTTNPDSKIVGKAFKDDIFRYINEENDWIEIDMFSGVPRYIHRSLVKVFTHGLSAPFSNDICPQLMERIEEVKERSLIESDDKSQNILLDSYILEIFHEFDLQPVIYSIAVNRCIEGLESKIGQRPTYIPKKSNSSQEKVEKPLTEKVKSQIEVNNIVQIIKKNAKEQWGNNTGMVNYEVEQQTTAYNWYIKENSYPNILKTAKVKWGNNFVMVKYEYEEQLSAYEWLERYTDYPSILESAKHKWGNNFVMVNYEYEEQVSAYEWLQKNKNINPGAFKLASNKWGNNYVMVKYEFEEMCK
jgi:hypothetical protein